MSLTGMKYGLSTCFHREQTFFGKTHKGFKANLNIFSNH
jgi:hypothetical protein